MTVMAIDRHRDHDRLLRAGEWLRKARNDRGLTAAELGEMIGTSPQNISNYERGIATVSDERAAKIADALGLDEITTRRGLGLWVPDETATEAQAEIAPTTLAAIQRDTSLLPEARKHLANQYELLRRLSPVPEQGDSIEEFDARLDAIAEATHDAVNKPIPRRKPRKTD